MVGLGRLELPTSRLSSARSNQLSYRPKMLDQVRVINTPPKTFVLIFFNLKPLVEPDGIEPTT
jgi:hypothetical protein